MVYCCRSNPDYTTVGECSIAPVFIDQTMFIFNDVLKRYDWTMAIIKNKVSTRDQMKWIEKLRKGNKKTTRLAFCVGDATFYPVMGIRLLLRINYTRILDSTDAILSFANRTQKHARKH
jgi:hypothetical protein